MNMTAEEIREWMVNEIGPWELRTGMHKRLNLGAGKDYKPMWTNHSQYQHSSRIDVACDLNELPWPWPSGQFSRVYAWAVLEHLKIDLVESLDEIWRILKPGGKVKLKLPCWNYYKAWRDPTHRWRFDPGVFTFFDPRTRNGKRSSYMTPFKWWLLDHGHTDKSKVAIWAEMRKVMSAAQMEDYMKGQTPPGARRIIWLNGRSQAGKSTLADRLRITFPHLVVVDDHYLWGDVWQYTYDKLRCAHTPGVDHFEDEQPESCHRDFAIECARVADVLARQGHTVLVSMIASPKARRERIREIIDPFWVYVKRETGEKKKPIFDKPLKGEYDLLVDCDKLGRMQAAALVAKALLKRGLL